MNPFEKLRRAVDKVTLVYQTPETTQPLPLNNPQQQPTIPPRSPRSQSPSFPTPTLTPTPTPTLSPSLEQNTKALQHLTQQSSKIQRLTRTLAHSQAQKQTLIQKLCISEKNNQLLEEKVNQLYERCGIVQDRERRYKEEIFRINGLLEGIGKELVQERNGKKNAVMESNRVKGEAEREVKANREGILQMEETITRLQQEIKQRTQMLEYNILKNSEQRKQSKLALQRQQSLFQSKLSQQSQKLSQLQTQLTSQRLSNQTTKFQNSSLQKQYNTILQQSNLQQQQLNTYKSKIQSLTTKISQLSSQLATSQKQKSLYEQQLRKERQNIKVKVVEIRDQSLEMELEMYRKQCRELLQERAVMGKLGGEKGERGFQILGSRQ